jgi:hypothetical protein
MTKTNPKPRMSYNELKEYFIINHLPPRTSVYVIENNHSSIKFLSYNSSTKEFEWEEETESYDEYGSFCGYHVEDYLIEHDDIETSLFTIAIPNRDQNYKIRCMADPTDGDQVRFFGVIHKEEPPIYKPDTVEICGLTYKLNDIKPFLDNIQPYDQI